LTRQNDKNHENFKRSKYMTRPRVSQAVDESGVNCHHSGVKNMRSWLNRDNPLVLGSLGCARDLQLTMPQNLQEQCDIVEIRLDLIKQTIESPPRPWAHLMGIPLLFTARRGDEGGAGQLPADERMRLLEATLDDAACIDIEVASIAEMKPLLEILADRDIPWIASFHDFEKLPETSALAAAADLAKAAGAAVFKAAAMLRRPADLARLADFQLAEHGIPVATMGMGPLAPVSRLLCAQCGSRLNYGFLGQSTTAPGQWSAANLRSNINLLWVQGKFDPEEILAEPLPLRVKNRTE
jgi:3-dehydroquinate dehydratase-1